MYGAVAIEADSTAGTTNGQVHGLQKEKRLSAAFARIDIGNDH
jgi:hypothetical protein